MRYNCESNCTFRLARAIGIETDPMVSIRVCLVATAHALLNNYNYYIWRPNIVLETTERTK